MRPPIEHPELPFSDETLKKALSTTDGSEAVFKYSPLLWLRSVMATESEREASEVEDSELVFKILTGSFRDLDQEKIQIIEGKLDLSMPPATKE